MLKIYQPLMIWNPALKNVLTYLGSADLQSAAKENAFCHADFADDADLSCYCGCRLYLPLLPEYYGLYYFVPYFSIKALFLWCFGDYITNHLRHLRHLRDFKSKPRICVNL